MYYKATLFFCIVLAQGITAFGRDKDEVVVSGRIISASASTSRVIKVNFCNPLIRGNKSAGLDGNMSFSLKEHMAFEQVMTVNFASFFIYLYVKPGDSVHLEIDASKLNQNDFSWLSIKGDHAQFSLDLNNCVLVLDKMPHLKRDLTLSPAEQLKATKKDLSFCMDSLKAYVAAHHIPDSVVHVVELERKYMLTMYLGEYVDLDDSIASRKQERIRFFADPFFDIHNPDNFQSMMFPIHLWNYDYFITRGDSGVKRAIQEDRFKDAVNRGISLLLKEPATPCRDYMIFNFAASFLDKRLSILDSLPALKQQFTQSLFYDYLARRVDQLKNPVFPYTPVAGISRLEKDGEIRPLPVTDLFAYLEKQYPGKVIYIDVYATWCEPCKKEFTFTPALHKAFAGKDVVFVNCCLGSNQGTWKKQVESEKLDGVNLFFTADASKLFLGTYALNGYPSYLLMNRSGKLVSTSALRPSENERTVQQINNLLNQGLQ